MYQWLIYLGISLGLASLILPLIAVRLCLQNKPFPALSLSLCSWILALNALLMLLTYSNILIAKENWSLLSSIRIMSQIVTIVFGSVTGVLNSIVSVLAMKQLA
ncbi:hypothetical protein [Filifactor villosus]|uniref:Uncharacterized protein n=1 Tax=Filifactor villosus TaxID=29374 RepID=A0ABV9QJV0_9FIRM